MFPATVHMSPNFVTYSPTPIIYFHNSHLNDTKWYLTVVLICISLMINGDCSPEIKRRLLLRRNVMTNLDSIFKGRDITLPTKVRLVKAMVFPVVMYGCESWTMKKAEGWRIDAFEPWCWRRLLRVPWTARRSSQSILKEINPGISLEGIMLSMLVITFLPRS